MSPSNDSPPTTPPRPSRRSRSLVISQTFPDSPHSETSSPSIPSEPMPITPNTSAICQSPIIRHDVPPTPPTPSRRQESRESLRRTKSISGIRRKPIPVFLSDTQASEATTSSDPPVIIPPRPITAVSVSSSTASTATLAPSLPSYTLTVDPPLEPVPAYASSIQAHIPMRPVALEHSRSTSTSRTLHGNDSEASFGLNAFGVAIGVERDTRSEHLPVYSEEEDTEPNTLAKELWKWGWFCPLLWAIGMSILWLPLRTEDEEERDPEKIQRMQEMIDIVRKTELKYAKRCLYGFLIFSVLIAVTVILAVVLTKVL